MIQAPTLVCLAAEAEGSIVGCFVGVFCGIAVELNDVALLMAATREHGIHDEWYAWQRQAFSGIISHGCQDDSSNAMAQVAEGVLVDVVWGLDLRHPDGAQ